VITVLNVAAAFAAFAAAALALRLSRAPGWRELLPAALVAGVTGVFGVVAVVLTDARAAAFAPALAQLRLGFGGAGVAAWIVYAGRDLGVPRPRLHRALVAAAAAGGALALVPGATFRAPVIGRPCAAAGGVYFDPTPTGLGYAVQAALLLTLATVIARYAAAALARRDPALTVQSGAFLLVVAAGANDVLGISGLADTPYLLGIAALLPVGVATHRLARRFAAESAALAALRAGLEEAAEERALELANADEALERAARLVELGRAAALVGHALEVPSAAAEDAVARAAAALRAGDAGRAAAAIHEALAAARRIADVVRAPALRVPDGRE
jgi:hypothetical protein